MAFSLPALALVLLLLACGESTNAAHTGDAEAPSDVPGAMCGELPSGSGDGTYYAADGSGNCSFDATPDDLLVAALNTEDYAGSVMCGACVEVQGPSGKVTVRIVDRCPGCKKGDIDLSESAFLAISPLAAGRVAIRWQLVACAVEGPVSYRFKEGSSQWWTALQLRNHRYPVRELEVRGEDGKYRSVPRESYNYFVAKDGLGSGPYSVRVTDLVGDVIEDAAVELGDGVVRSGGSQFPLCQ